MKTIYFIALILIALSTVQAQLDKWQQDLIDSINKNLDRDYEKNEKERIFQRTYSSICFHHSSSDGCKIGIPKDGLNQQLRIQTRQYRKSVQQFEKETSPFDKNNDGYFDSNEFREIYKIYWSGK